MLLIATLVATVLPPALVWRVLHRRQPGWWALVLGSALAAGACFAGWRATTAADPSASVLPWTALVVGGLWAAWLVAGHFRSGRLR